MAITKETEVGMANIIGKHKICEVRDDTVFKEDGVEQHRSFNKRFIPPCSIDADNNMVETDISGEDSLVQDVCNIYWTDEVKEAYRDFLISQKG
jgi:hypothetical protein